MSAAVDAHELERAALQKKDREQLQAIATAMGRKPPSRLRKDQIIDLILELSGVGPGGQAAEAPPARRGRSKARAEETATLFAGDAPAPAAEVAPLPAQPAPPSGDVGAEVTAEPTGAVEPEAPTPAVEPARPSRRSRAAAGDDGGRSAARQVRAATSESSPSPAAPTPDTSSPAPSTQDPPTGDTSAQDTSAQGSPTRDTTSGDAPDAALSSSVTAGSDQPGGEHPRGDQARGDQPRAEQSRGDRPAPTSSRSSRMADGPSWPAPAASSAPARFVYDPLEGAEDDGGRHGDDEGGNGRAGTGGQPGQAGDPADGSSRRRRRRGKDRNRVDTPVPPGANPSGTPGAAAPQQAAPPTEGGGEQEPVPVAGYLDLREEGYGFLRVRSYLPSKEDVYVPSKFVRQFGLRKGDHVSGSSRPAGRGEKNPALLRVDTVNGRDPERARSRPRFEDLVAVFPYERLMLEADDGPAGDADGTDGPDDRASDVTARVVDVVTPIGKGQRGLIVSPPGAGKTTLIKLLARALEQNNPEVKVIVVLIDERPEEVTDMRRSVEAEVVASTFDRPAEEHTQVVELTLERAKRMVETGDDVVILLDGITRLTRAHNLASPATGRALAGGLDTGALQPAKRFFGAARNIDEGGSLTILATALVGTGSTMDEVIYEEFGGTGNLELRLDRDLADEQVFPAIDLVASGTRHEEVLLDDEDLLPLRSLRRSLAGAGDGAPGAGLKALLGRIGASASNDELLAAPAEAGSPSS